MKKMKNQEQEIQMYKFKGIRKSTKYTYLVICYTYM